MPTYVYKRPDGTLFEAFQKISDPALAVDPETGVPVVRVISGGAGLQFKGTGFYLTDYARSGDTGSKAASNAEEPASTKPAAPSESAAPAAASSPSTE